MRVEMNVEGNLWPAASDEPLRHAPDRRGASSNGMTAFAGWLLTVAICFAPWAFGSRPYWAALSLAAILSCAVVSWTIGWIWQRRFPAVHRICWCAVIFLAVFAVLSILNPRSSFDAALGTFVPNVSYVPFLPATVDVRTDWTFTLEMLSYLFVIPAAADLSASTRWSRRFLEAIALNGLLVALAGLWLKAGGSPALHDYLQQRPWAQGEIFGPFDYHGNAGAFLNLSLPAAAWMAAAGARAKRVFWRSAVGVLYVALFVNSSRAAFIIGLFLSPLCLWLAFRENAVLQFPVLHRRQWVLWIGASFAALAVLGSLLLTLGSKQIRRMRHLPIELIQPSYPRYLQSRAAFEMAQERPLFGAGIGSYKVLVQTSSIRGYFFAPYFHPGDPFTVLGETHEDYLQTFVEWGWIGFCAWAVLVAGAFRRVWRWLRVTHLATRTGLAIGLALISVYLHALGDCPLQIPALQFYTALYLGLAWGSPKSEPASQVTPALL